MYCASYIMKDNASQPDDSEGFQSSHADLRAELRGFGPIGIVSIIIILLFGNYTAGPIVIPFGAILILLWAYWSRTPWHDIGYVRPNSWARAIITGLTFGVVFKLILKAVIMPLLGADPVNHAYHYLAGNRAILPAAIWAMINAGFAEETVFRGYMFERLGKLLGTQPWAKVAIVAFTSVWFGWEHYSVQGMAGVEQATIAGLLYGSIFMATRKIWIVMIAHAAFDLTALAIIYLNIENQVAHILFK